MKKLTLSDIFQTIRNGANIKQFDANGIPITRIESISNETLNYDKLGYADIFDDRFENYYLTSGDILMSHINSMQHLGKTALVSEVSDKIIHGMNLLCLKDILPTISPDYMNYYFKSKEFKKQVIKISKKSVNQASFSISDLKKVPVEIPSEHDQAKVVQNLVILDKLIVKRQEQLSVLDNLVKSRFNEMFGDKYPIVKLGKIIRTVSGGTPLKSKAEYYNNGTIPWLTSGEVNAGIITSVENFITEEGMKNSSAKLIPANSVVIAMYGATAGVTGILRLESTTNQAVCSLLPNDNFIPEYLYYAVSFKKEWMISQCKGGGQPNISQTIIRNLDLINAPLVKQSEFADFVKQVDKSKLAVKQSLEELETLKKKLMQDYFG